MIDWDDAVWALLLLTNTAWAMALVYFLINSGKKTFVTEPPQPLNMNGRSGAADASLKGNARRCCPTKNKGDPKCCNYRTTC
ncbi:hypothetical protein DIPPA_14836 [Diplonema papillatum]|nr:hypothetical protein DIPPA_14836 [Diplonema papillatum]